MSKSLEQLRRDAKSLRKAYEAGEAHARQRISVFLPRSDGTVLKHADYLHVVARENSFISWPAMKFAVELLGMDRAQRRQRLKGAVHHGQFHVIEQLLSDMPDLADGDFGLEIALFRKDAVAAALQKEPSLATRIVGKAPPLVHLAHSRMLKLWPERQGDMLAIAELLLANGADVDLGSPAYEGSDHMLSPLYFAIGHADNMALGQWLLEHGANPNDNESLYHSTELGHHEGLRLLLAHGADPKGTNAMLRAMDFHDVEAVKMLLAAGALADEFDGTHVGGERPFVVPALHQAARRMCSPEMIELLLDAGADPTRTFEGCTAFGHAKVFGNHDLASAMARRGVAAELTKEEALLAKAADGEDTAGQFVDPDRLPNSYRNIIRTILHLPDKLDHVKRLVAIGVEFDRPDDEGLTPLHVSGWEGLPEVMAYFMKLKADLAHVNGYGGTLLSTIIHGSENCPARKERDYIACLKLALEAGAALPRRASEVASDEAIAEFLAEWGRDHPGQVVEGSAV
jgi:ankyrin repeat protein